METIGIDLGTTNSVATVYSDGVLEHISFDNSYLLPSVVNISDDGVIVGIKAKNMLAIASESSVMSIKREMGIKDSVEVDKKSYTPEEISSFILKRIKNEAQNQKGKIYSKCVITVPAYFNEQQREATKEAARLAGFEVLRVLNEPTAAAISYGIDKDSEISYGVYDLGGGTFDISIIENSKGLIEVLSTSGDNHLGGDDFDRKLADLIWDRASFDIAKTKAIDYKLLKIAERAKIELSDKDVTIIDEKFFAKDGSGKPLHLELEITKDDFYNLIRDDILKTIRLLKEALEDADLEIDNLDVILLTGGSSRIPLIAELIHEECGKLPILIDDPDKSVSIGAMLQGAIIEGLDVNSILVDITPYSLGSSVFDHGHGMMLSKIIQKNTPVPVSKTSRFYAIAPFQKQYKIDVYQGENEFDLSQNVEIGNLMLNVKNPVEDGSVDVTFTLDQNGILNVSAKDVATNEIVEGSFKTTIGKTSKKSSMDSIEILQNCDSKILGEIEELLKREDILDEDKNDLRALKDRYLSSDEDERGEIEEEIVDTIFFLKG